MRKEFTTPEAKEIGDRIGVDWKKFEIEEFRKGISVELEHGTRYPKWNVTGDCPYKTGKIVAAHLEELPDYYTRLDIMEKTGKAVLAARSGKQSEE
jgi:hypothetical protein